MPRVVAALALAAGAGCSSTARDGAPATGRAADGGEAVPLTTVCAPHEARAAVRTAYDIPYAQHGGERLALDVAWPRDAGGPRPLVVLLHGGGWSGGSRESLHDEMLALARLGYAAATVQYRLTRAPRNLFPAATADVRCAVRFLRAHAADYGIDRDRVAAAGFSAGAHLASLLGVAADVPALADDDARCTAAGGDDDGRVQAVIAYAGPQDLRVDGPYTQEQADLVTNFLGAFPGDAPARAALASPIAHVGAGDPPFLLIQGARDDLVPPAHARRMAAALRGVGTPATVLELRGVGHAFLGLAASADAAVRCTTEAFLARWLGPGDAREE